MKENWINIKDRLPTNEQNVLVYDETNDYDFAWFNQIKKKWYRDSYHEYEFKVTYWQPLEEPN